MLDDFILTDLFEFLENEELAEGASRNNSDGED